MLFISVCVVIILCCINVDLYIELCNVLCIPLQGLVSEQINNIHVVNQISKIEPALDVPVPYCIKHQTNLSFMSCEAPLFIFVVVNNM